MLYDRSSHYSQSHKAMVTNTIPKLTAYVNAHIKPEPVQQPQRQHGSAHFPNEELLIISRSVLHFSLNSFNFTKAEC